MFIGYKSNIKKKHGTFHIIFWVLSHMRQRPLRGDPSYFQMAFYGLFYVRLGYIWLGDCPAGLEPPAGAINRN